MLWWLLRWFCPPIDPHWPCRPAQGLLGCFGLTEKLAGVNSPVLCTASVQGLEMRERWAESLTDVDDIWHLTIFLVDYNNKFSQVPLLGFLLPYQRVGPDGLQDALAGSFFTISLRIPFHLFICLQDVCKMPWNPFLHLCYVSSDFSFICLPPLSVLDALPELFGHGIYCHFGLLSLGLLDEVSVVVCSPAPWFRFVFPFPLFFVVCTNRLAGFLVCPTTCHKHVPKFLATLASSTPEVVELWTPLQNGMTGSQLPHFLWLQVCYVGLGWFGCGLKLL